MSEKQTLFELFEEIYEVMGEKGPTLTYAEYLTGHIDGATLGLMSELAGCSSLGSKTLATELAICVNSLRRHTPSQTTIENSIIIHGDMNGSFGNHNPIEGNIPCVPQKKD